MKDLEFKKFPILATMLSILIVVLSVVAITIGLSRERFVYTGSLFTGLALLVASVLFIAGLTTGKIHLLKVISIMSSVGVIVTSFVFAVMNFETHQTVLFSLSILMLICSVLSYIYFLTSARNARIKNMYLVAIIVMACLTFAYAMVYILQNVDSATHDGSDFDYTNYLLLFGFILLILIPLSIRFAVSQKEVKPEEKKELDNQADEGF